MEKENMYYDLINEYNSGSKSEKDVIINTVINYNDARLYRLILLNCVLSEKDTKLLESNLHSLKDSIDGFAENFYYLLQTDRRQLNFENGFDDIENFIDRAFRKRGLSIPEEIEELIRVNRENSNSDITIGNTIAWISQHVMVDDKKSNAVIPFDNTKVLK